VEGLVEKEETELMVQVVVVVQVPIVEQEVQAEKVEMDL
jgi:hypothetical protein